MRTSSTPGCSPRQQPINSRQFRTEEEEASWRLMTPLYMHFTSFCSISLISSCVFSCLLHFVISLALSVLFQHRTLCLSTIVFAYLKCFVCSCVWSHTERIGTFPWFSSTYTSRIAMHSPTPTARTNKRLIFYYLHLLISPLDSGFRKFDLLRQDLLSM